MLLSGIAMIGYLASLRETRVAQVRRLTGSIPEILDRRNDPLCVGELAALVDGPFRKHVVQKLGELLPRADGAMLSRRDLWALTRLLGNLERPMPWNVIEGICRVLARTDFAPCLSPLQEWGYGLRGRNAPASVRTAAALAFDDVVARVDSAGLLRASRADEVPPQSLLRAMGHGSRVH